jgi:hypothetical protein
MGVPALGASSGDSELITTATTLGRALPSIWSVQRSLIMRALSAQKKKYVLTTGDFGC